jgi:hypothetical protein
MTVKVDFKRELPNLYKPGRDPALVEVPELSFLMIDGHGDPNTSAEYLEALEALFSVSYTLKFTVKRAAGGFDYAVMPLEGLWWSPDGWNVGFTDKSAWEWTSMIMQPDEITAEMVSDAIEAARTKRPIPAADAMRLERFDEGLSAQLMHFGSYAEEGPNIVRLHHFIADSGYVPVGKHHEIYLGDPRRSAPEKLRTVIRQPIAPV